MIAERNWWPWAVVAILAGGSWAIVRMFHVSAASGDVFPEYSSLRPDPMGTKALHDSLASLDGYRVERSFVPWDRLVSDNATVLVLNSPAMDLLTLVEPEFVDLEDRARKGARLVVALKRERWTYAAGAPKEPLGKLLAERWKLRIAPVPGGGVTLVLLDQSWRALRTIAGRVTAAERKFGGGAVVVVADSFPFSNEALRTKRDTALLLDILGDGRHIVFEESHLGAVLAGSVGQLLRRYQLQGAAIVLLLLAALYLWRASSSLVPALADDSRGVVEGRSQGDALTGLIRRALTPQAAPAMLLAIWKKSGAMLPALSEPRRARVSHELEAAGEKDLLAAWNRIHDIVHKRT